MDVRVISNVPDPVLRNLQITQCYHELARAFGARLAGNANWCAFATWASKQAGQTIRREDLRRYLTTRIQAAVGMQDPVERVVSFALAAGSHLTAHELRAAVWGVLDPAAAVDRASTAVARGNLKVFAEIAAVFARFNAEYLGAATYDQAHIDALRQTLKPGDPPDGQRHLRQAFTHYYQALFEADPKARTELVFLGNLEVGFHEQTRLQPEIAEALQIADLDARTVTNRLIAAVFPRAGWISRLRSALARLLRGPTPLELAVAALVAEARNHMRRLLSQHVLTLGLPNSAALPLGRDLRDQFPASLAHVSNAELLALLRHIDPTPDSVRDSGALDWSDLPERLHFICDFFRCHHERADLFMPPFSPAQVAALEAGRVPAGDL